MVVLKLNLTGKGNFVGLLRVMYYLYQHWNTFCLQSCRQIEIDTKCVNGNHDVKVDSLFMKHTTQQPLHVGTFMLCSTMSSCCYLNTIMHNFIHLTWRRDPLLWSLCVAFLPAGMIEEKNDMLWYLHKCALLTYHAKKKNFFLFVIYKSIMLHISYKFSIYWFLLQSKRPSARSFWNSARELNIPFALGIIYSLRIWW